MIIGYLLVAIFAGLTAFIVSLLLGTSLPLAFGAYTMVATVTLIMVPLTRMLVGTLINQSKTSSATPEQNRQKDFVPVDKFSGSAETPIRALVVDDDPFILDLVPIISEKAGFSETTTAAFGEEALKILADTKKNFDCILLDINMPGMDGIELCGRVRQIAEYRQTPIIMLTGKRDMQNMGEAYRSGANDYLTKPFDIEELETRLRSTLRMIQTKRDLAHLGFENMPFAERNPIPDQGSKLPEALYSLGRNSLIDHAAFLSYLTQLPRREVANVRVFGVRIDGVDSIQAEASEEQLMLLFEDLAAATVDCFGAGQTVMAYADKNTLLVATNSVNPPTTKSIETSIQSHLEWHLSLDDSGLEKLARVSVGGPVQLQSMKAQRAETATHEVDYLLNDRAKQKRKKQVVDVSKR
ncbi:PleD family two-component system response regulator [Marimonas sp. MJW-29]|uniref:PleD family two-component system response regulator n=1 Tax=Sulfitobacter sediminis TaxID=3234186 RepID=A0ABV3RT85_9RHOB